MYEYCEKALPPRGARLKTMFSFFGDLLAYEAVRGPPRHRVDAEPHGGARVRRGAYLWFVFYFCR